MLPTESNGTGGPATNIIPHSDRRDTETISAVSRTAQDTNRKLVQKRAFWIGLSAPLLFPLLFLCCTKWDGAAFAKGLATSIALVSIAAIVIGAFGWSETMIVAFAAMLQSSLTTATIHFAMLETILWISGTAVIGTECLIIIACFIAACKQSQPNPNHVKAYSDSDHVSIVSDSGKPDRKRPSEEIIVENNSQESTDSSGLTQGSDLQSTANQESSDKSEINGTNNDSCDPNQDVLDSPKIKDNLAKTEEEKERKKLVAKTFSAPGKPDRKRQSEESIIFEKSPHNSTVSSGPSQGSGLHPTAKTMNTTNVKLSEKAPLIIKDDLAKTEKKEKGEKARKEIVANVVDASTMNTTNVKRLGKAPSKKQQLLALEMRHPENDTYPSINRFCSESLMPQKGDIRISVNDIRQSSSLLIEKLPNLSILFEDNSKLLRTFIQQLLGKDESKNIRNFLRKNTHHLALCKENADGSIQVTLVIRFYSNTMIEKIDKFSKLERSNISENGQTFNQILNSSKCAIKEQLVTGKTNLLGDVVLSHNFSLSIIEKMLTQDIYEKISQGTEGSEVVLSTLYEYMSYQATQKIGISNDIKIVQNRMSYFIFCEMIDRKLISEIKDRAQNAAECDNYSKGSMAHYLRDKAQFLLEFSQKNGLIIYGVGSWKKPSDLIFQRLSVICNYYKYLVNHLANKEKIDHLVHGYFRNIFPEKYHQALPWIVVVASFISDTDFAHTGNSMAG